MLKTVSSITNAIGALNYKGTWNASTNTPDLSALTPDKGDYYVVSVAGSTSLGGISTWYVGDWAVYNGAVWQRVEGGADDPAPSVRSNSTTGLLEVTGPGAGTTRVMTTPDANFTAARTDAAQSFTGDQTLSTGNLVVGTNGKGIVDSGNVDRVSVASGVTVVNESGADIDFRVEGDNDANTLFVDAGNDRVGVGTNAPGYRFNVAIAGRGAGANYSSSAMEASTIAFIDAGENDLNKASTLTLRQFNSAGSIAVGYTSTFTGFMDLGVSNGAAQSPVQRVRIGAGGQIYFPGVGTTASAANAFLNNGSTPANELLRSTSSIRYKTDIEDLEHDRSQAVLNLRPVWYRSLAQADRKDWSWYGLIAEEVAEVEPRLVHWTYPESEYEEVEKDVEVDQTTTDDQGNEVTEKVTQTITERQLKPNAKLVPDGVQYDRLTVMLLDVVKQQNKLIESLDARIAALEGK